MTGAVGSGLLAFVAVWLAVPRSPQVALRRLAPPPAARSRREAVPVAAAVGVVAALVAAWLLGGPGTVALGLSGAILAGTVGLVLWRRRRTRRALRRMKEVARASEVLGSLVRIGHVPAAALRIAAADCPVLEPVAAVQQVGGDPVAALRTAGRGPGAHGLVAIARAWEVSVATGAPMAGSLEAVTDELRAAKDLAQVVDAELAAPRATGQLLAALPFVGIGLGVAMGADPLGFLTGSVVGQVCLVVGVLLACAGVVWSEVLADRAADRHHGRSGRRRGGAGAGPEAGGRKEVR